MSEQDKHKEHSQESLAALVLEIDKIPKEYWSNLLQIIRVYRDVTIKNIPQDSWKKTMQEGSPVLRVINFINLLVGWVEQRETQRFQTNWLGFVPQPNLQATSITVQG